MKTVLVTGSNGLIASKIIIELAQNPELKVVATSHSPLRWVLPEGVRFELLDITNHSNVSYLLGLYTPDIVINTAAITKPDDCEKDAHSCWKVNTEAVQHLANYCNLHTIYFIQFSTDFVFDGTDAYYTEESTPNPLSAYARSKTEADQYVYENCSRYAIIRTSLVYGNSPAPGRSNLLSWVKSSLEAGNNIRVVCDQYRTPTLAEDIAHGIALLISKEETGIFNLSGRDYMSVYEIAVRTAEFYGLDTKLIHEVQTIELNEPARRPMRTFLKTEKARVLLGYEPTSFADGLQLINN